ncbi:hypothetical protein PsalMR5_03200 [Piscirickettsia salmonis]|uniref:hypothetical protein n=1 Tax=Piscirickettsia salmonis TaxID=1238 RepID=UPI0012BA92F6|nr:hypothetical protein [Piscirickettsia salmonis]QGP55741.1 hypothetical protein PsalSR1_03195 [Piscirickettsia salmonis]QGP58393.1 hypothetical protein PsalBI1_00964 [Piscirickettsia salmonis]QGP65310.1 hypothetical protein PsalMR5_03200 [Piscirickettsia salmonis]
MFKKLTYKKSIYFSLFTLLAITFSLKSQATSASITNKINNNIQANLAGLHISYKETLNGSIFNEEQGNVPGLNISLSKTVKNLYLHANVSLYSGKYTYDGGYSSGGSTVPFSFKYNRPLYNLSGRLGYRIKMNPHLHITPYGEFGYYQWDRHLIAPPVANGIAIDEIYRHYFAGIGAKLDIQIGSRFILSPHASLGSTLNPVMDFSAVEPATHIEDTLALGQKPYYQLGIDMMYLLSDHFSITGFIRYKSFEYGESSTTVVTLAPSTQALAAEPDSVTRLLTFGIGASYNF